MAEGGYKIRNAGGIHFVTFAVVEWVDVFSRKEYKDVLIESLAFCQEKKGLVLYGWCIMSNHVHFMASAQNNNLSDILRDFKKYTSTQIVSSILKNQQESRKDWMMNIFEKAGRENSRNTGHQFWRQDNHPIECFSPDFTRQKMDYLHNNPVAAGIVFNPEDYVYSSAGDYAGRKGLLKVELLF
jgi:putative transposase